MTNKGIKPIYYFFVFILITLFAFLVRRGVESVTQSYDNNMTFGTYVLTDDNIQEPIELTGTYRYIEDKLVEPDDIDLYYDNIESKYIYDSGSLLTGKEGTLMFTIYNYSSQERSLQLGNFFSKYKVYVNGILTTYNSVKNNTSFTDKIYIDLQPNTKTDVLIQLSRDNFFLFGFLSPPTIDTFANQIATTSTKNFISISIISVIIAQGFFLIILSILRSVKIKDNLSILTFTLAGFFICGRMALLVLSNYNLITIDYVQYFIIKTTTLVLVAYLLFLTVCFSSKLDSESKILKNLITNVFIGYILFSIICPISARDIYFKLSLLLIISIELATFYSSSMNILNRNYYAILTFIISAIFYIFVFMIPNIYIYTLEYNLIIVYSLSSLIILIKIAVDNYKLYANFKYLSKLHKITNDIHSIELENTKRLLQIESNAKNHAIRISQESKKRDVFTGLYNRFYAVAIIDDLYANLKEDEFISFILIDIDNLRYINSAYGRKVADSLITKIADVLLSYKTKNDYIARWSGDTFLVIMKNSEIGTATYIAENIRKNVSEIKFHNSDVATVSIGVASTTNTSPFEVTEYILNSCLERAKNMGRNCVVSSKNILSDEDIFEQYEYEEDIYTDHIRNPYTGELF